jgi:K+-sensing histidine kinase KdpD
LKSTDQEKLELINRLAIASVDREDLSQYAQWLLDNSARLVGLAAASMYLWDDKMQPTVNVSFAVREASQKKLLTAESDLFQSLRLEKNLMSAFMSFGGEKPYHLFTIPLRHGGQLFGALIGIQEGKLRPDIDNSFLETLTAVLSLSLAADQSSLAPESSKQAIEKARLSAITDTAVTVNHEVNNPLTAILGNVQLLLAKQENLNSDAIKKLRVVEESALKIKDVTQKLLKLTHSRTVEYTDGATMLDLSDEGDS